MPQVRIPVPLLSGGMSDSAADQGGMDPTEVLSLEECYFDTPSSLSVRRGSIDSSQLLDANGYPMTSIPFVEAWEDKGLIVAIGHEASGINKHYLFTLNPDGTNPTRYAMPAAWNSPTPICPIVGVATPTAFYFVDAAQLVGYSKFDGTVVTAPPFTLGSGPPAALRFKHIFVHANQMIGLGYGDENTPAAPAQMRFSNIGDFDTWAPDDFIDVGTDNQPLYMGLSWDEYAILFKERMWYALAGSGRQSWEVIRRDGTFGVVGVRHAKLVAGSVWHESEQGFCRIAGAGTPSKLIVDKVKLAWSGMDKLTTSWITAADDERMVYFGLHDHNDVAMSYPTVILAVDWRTERWVKRRYLGATAGWMAACQMPQDLLVTGSLGPTAAPSGSRTTSITRSSFQAIWLVGDTTASTEFWQKTGPAGAYALVTTLDPGVTTLARAGLTNHTEYFWKVRQVKNGIASSFDTEQDVKTLIQAPDIGGCCTGVASNTQISVSQNAGGTDIHIDKSTDNVSWLTDYRVLLAQPAGVTVLALPTGCFAWFRARSVDAAWTPTDSDYGLSGQISDNC